MPKKITEKNNIVYKNAAPKEKDYKIFDGKGLFLLVTKTGSKLWRLKYSFNGKEKLLSLGSYPEILPTEARNKCTEARNQLANGVDPSEFRKSVKRAGRAIKENSFESVAREWHTKFKSQWSEAHAATTLSRLEKDIFPWIGNRPIDELEPPEVLKVLQRMEVRGILESVKRMKTACSQIFRYGIAHSKCKRDPVADLKGAIPPPIRKNMAALTRPDDVAHLLRAIDNYKGSFVVKCALQLAALWFCRPGELRNTKWSEIDFDKAELNIPVERMKLPTPTKRKCRGQYHCVPLSKQAVEILKELHPLTGYCEYVFPSIRTSLKPISEAAVLNALRRMGYEKDEMTGHGFRAMARTMIREQLHFESEYIELQLAHATKSPNGTAYDRVSFLPERRKMMQLWADYLDGLKQGAKVIPLKKTVVWCSP